MALTVQGRPSGDKTYQVMDQLQNALWYERAGESNDETEEQLKQFMKNLQVENYDIKWIRKEEAPRLIGTFTFENSAIWEQLKDVPDHFMKQIEEKGKQQQLDELIDRVPEFIYLRTFERAYALFQDKQLIQYLVVHGMYISTLACIAALLEDELFIPIVEMVKDGHIPLGIKGNTVYLL